MKGWDAEMGDIYLENGETEYAREKKSRDRKHIRFFHVFPVKDLTERTMIYGSGPEGDEDGSDGDSGR